MSIKKVFIALTLVIALVIPTSCAKAPPKPSRLIPADSTLIAEAQIDKILGDEDVAEIYEMIAAERPFAPDTFDEALDKLEDKTGIDARDFEKVTFFGDASSFKRETPYFGVIAEGTFNKENLLKKIEEACEEEFQSTDYRGHTIYSPELEEAGFTFGEGLMIVASMDALKDVLDIWEGEAKPISGKLYDTYKDLGAVWAKTVLELPKPLLGKIPSEKSLGPMKAKLSYFRDADMAASTMTKEGETFVQEVKLHFTKAKSAEGAEETTDSLLKMAEGMVGMTSPELKSLFEKIQLKTQDSWLSLSYRITVDDIKALMKTFERFKKRKIVPKP